MATWTPRDGYFSTLLSALLGRATLRQDGRQDTGGAAGHAAGQLISADAALKISAVWACVRLLAEAVGAMPVNVYRVGAGGVRTEDPGHWLFKLLNRPNRYQTRNEFFETLIINLYLHGNFYVQFAPRLKDGRILSLLPMMPAQVQVNATAGHDRSYVYTDGVDVLALSQARVWHVPLMPSNGLIGLSPLQYGARTMGIAIAAEDRVATLAANGFKPTGVLMIDKILKPEQRTAIRNEFNDLQEGKGDPLKVLEAGMKYQQISMNPKDVQLLETRRFSTEDIARFYGVPSVLINDTSTSTVWGSGIGEIKEGFYTLALQPLLEKLESSIKRWLLPDGERDNIEVEFDFSRFLRGSDAKAIEAFTKAISGNLLTMDEARAGYKGLQPFPGGVGAVPYAQSQMIPIGSQPDPAAPEEDDEDDEANPAED